jgi:puromycin-sensitive aminopeptidase
LDTAANDPHFRLPRTVLPRRYRLSVAPDLGAARFEGTAVVEVDIAQPVTEIVCNAAELDVHAAVLVDSSGVELTGTVEHDDELERLTVALPSAAAAGAATLTLKYSGVLNDKLRGFYRSTFTDSSGETRVIATTQFEATDARRAFPCWDEPDAKAVFEVELLVPEDLIGVSNTGVVDERPGPGGRWLRFAPTIPMSTYLVAWVVGPLEFSPTVNADGTALRVVCPPGKSKMADFSLEVGAHALRYFSEYFGIPYPGDKLDLVALPDFAFGAMENLGCVTFRETALLVEPATASREELERVADVVSHEIAHMWFGDLVTMRWWNGIWLNEAFATFMEVKCVESFRPEWHRWVSFSSARAAAQGIDGLASTRPIEFPVVSPDDAEGMFDLLTYQKGGAVLRMLEMYLGEERFRDGIRQYLDAHKYANTETTDLWDALEAASGEPVRALMDTWILQGGHPEVAVDGDLSSGRLSLAQRRFRFRPDPEDEHVRWDVPVLLRIERGDRRDARRVLLTEARQEVDLGGATDAVVANDGGWGFFRTRYAPALLGRVIDGFPTLGPIERFNLVSDTWASVVAGSTPAAGFIGLARRVGETGESDVSVWDAVLGPLRTLDRIALPADQPEVAAFVRSLVRPPFAGLGWLPQPDEDERAGTLRANLAQVLGTFGEDEDVRRRAVELHHAYLGDRGAVPADLLRAVVVTVAWNGGEEDYETFVERARSAATPQEEERYLFTLSVFRQAELMQRTLDMALSEIRTQNAPFVIGGAMANRWQGPLAWNWLKQHWDAVLTRFPHNTISRMLEGTTSLTQPEVAADVREFLAAHPVGHAQLQVRQILERLEINTAFRQREGPALGGALAAR